MTWGIRLRLFAGVVGVIVLVGALTLLFNQRQNQVTSFTGSVAADTYEVGADYPGTVIAQDVEVGDRVRVGQRLFVIRSLQLREAIRNGLEVSDSEAYKVNGLTGTISYYAVSDGLVQKLKARVGNSLGSDGSLATIAADVRFVEADFKLVPRDYARVQVGSPAKIRLANDEVILGQVTSVGSATGELGTVSRVRVDSEALAAASAALRNPGAPVSVTVMLEDTGPLAGVQDAVKDLLLKVGLR